MDKDTMTDRKTTMDKDRQENKEKQKDRKTDRKRQTERQTERTTVQRHVNQVKITTVFFFFLLSVRMKRRPA